MKANILSAKKSCRDGFYILDAEYEFRGKTVKKTFEITDDDYAEIGSPVGGDTVYDEDFYTLARITMDRDAVDSALRIVAVSDNSIAGLMRKLLDRGYPTESAERAAYEMKRLGYINEPEQISRLVEYYVNTRKTGKKKLLAAITAKGYPPDVTNRIIQSAIDDGTIDFDALRDELTAGITDPTEKRKILYRHGF